MAYFSTVILVAVLVSQVYSAPQFISFTDGKLGVNFGGYHAAVGLGGLLGNGANGGLFAEAGTPFGQSAKAGLGGAVNSNGGTAGGLYAGATAGGNVQAAAGLAGSVNSENSAGGGYASAQAGNRFAVSSLGGEVSPSSGFAVTSDIEKNVVVTKEEEIIPTQLNTDAANEIKPAEENQLDFKSKSIEETNFKANTVNEIQQPIQEKDIIHANYKPHGYFHKSSYASSHVDTESNFGPITPVLVQKRVDIGTENLSAQTGTKTFDEATYKKEVNVGRNSHFFEDIFNIPIAALTAVRTLLTNTAGNTSVSYQKSGAIQAETESISPKHASSSSVKSSDAQISVKTPNASQVLDDILAIPINTLGAVNKFLDNNVPIRKRVSREKVDEARRIRLGPHARRRAYKEIHLENIQDNQR